ncbi:MAG: hypothetical protein IBX70_14180 [Clostridia bacterium]|nr:hypothetical protein [Clostridia bacterium]
MKMVRGTKRRPYIAEIRQMIFSCNSEKFEPVKSENLIKLTLIFSALNATFKATLGFDEYRKETAFVYNSSCFNSILEKTESVLFILLIKF